MSVAAEEEGWTSDTKAVHVLAPNSSSPGEPTCILVAVCRVNCVKNSLFLNKRRVYM